MNKSKEQYRGFSKGLFPLKFGWLFAVLVWAVSSSNAALAQYHTNTYDGTTTFKVTKTTDEVKCAFNAKNLAGYGLAAADQVLVHYVEWADDNTFSEKWLSIDSDKKDTKDYENKRFFGRSHIIVLAVHSNADSAADITYQVEVKKKVPQWASSLQTLFGLAPRQCRYGTLDMSNVPVPSDINIKGEWSVLAVPKTIPEPSRGSIQSNPRNSNTGERPAGAGQRGNGGNGQNFPNPVNSDQEVQTTGQAAASNAANNQQKLNFSAQFDNESKYWADLSIGVPVNTYRLTDYVVANGVLQRKQASRQIAYGFLNIFPWKEDTKSETWLQKPHGMIGIPLKGKSLQHPAVALGLGTTKFGIKIDFFAGVVFNRTVVPNPSAGTTATTDRWVRKGLFGFNIPVQQFVSIYEKKK